MGMADLSLGCRREQQLGQPTLGEGSTGCRPKGVPSTSTSWEGRGREDGGRMERRRRTGRREKEEEMFPSLTRALRRALTRSVLLAQAVSGKRWRPVHRAARGRRWPLIHQTTRRQKVAARGWLPVHQTASSTESASLEYINL
ncbi:unnamed protein product [Prorocentrum cordatum]|uniref:Uncharacterized protein n=1 Tax=Prorocentrum cordatum TaxID=2364126 RepID=A0ABN9SUL1_9DINO|nr:unnamed protein product [Polarella glacialis]